MSKSYLTPNQVADLLMVSPAAVRQWVGKGDLVALSTPGGHRRFLPRDVKRFARERGLTLNIESDELRVLIVDDDEQLSRNLVSFIGGFDNVIVESANDGFAAGLKVKEFEPHVVLLDLMMPGLDGFQVCSMLKNSSHTKGIRVIAMADRPSKNIIDRILSAGVETCLSKPLDAETLLEHIGINATT